MTRTQHRTGQAATPAPNRRASDGGSPGDNALSRAARDGKAPGGMWWVAWRQHHGAIITLAVVFLVGAIGMVVFHEIVVARFNSAGCSLDTGACPPEVGNLWRSSGLSDWSGVLHLLVGGGAVVLGVYVGSAAVASEFAHRTHVFALTQSVDRLRWWAVKVIATGAPLVAGLVWWGFLMGWADDAVAYSAHPTMGQSLFAVEAMIPAAHGLIALAIAVAVGMVVRSPTGATGLSLVLSAAVVIVLLSVVQPRILPSSRVTTPIAAVSTPQPAAEFRSDRDAAEVSTGYLDAAGNTVEFDATACRQAAASAANAAGNEAPKGAGADSGAPPKNVYATTFATCAHEHGAAYSYTDYLPGSMLWPLRWAMTGISVIIAALFLLLGAVRLRKAVAKQ